MPARAPYRLHFTREVRATDRRVFALGGGQAPARLAHRRAQVFNRHYRSVLGGSACSRQFGLAVGGLLKAPLQTPPHVADIVDGFRRARSSCRWDCSRLVASFNATSISTLGESSIGSWRWTASMCSSRSGAALLSNSRSPGSQAIV